MNYLTLFLTEKCQKRCGYCDIGVMKNRKHIDESLLNQYLPVIAKSEWQYIVLTGGEPALIKEDLFFETLDFLKFKHIRVNTNGMLFYKGYFEKYYKYINEVQYHPVSEITYNFDVIRDEKITYNFPIHKNNIQYLKSLLDTYYDIPIMLTPYDNKIDDDSLSLSTKDYGEVYSIIKDRDNIKEDTKRLFRFLGNMVHLDFVRNYCFNMIVAYPSIDFVHGRIKKCIRSHTRSDWKPLTMKNFQNLRNLDFENKKICDKCNFFIKDFEQIIRNMI